MQLTQALDQFALWLLRGPDNGTPRSERTVEAYTGAVRRIVGTAAVAWDNPTAMAKYLADYRTRLQTEHASGRTSASKIRVDVAGVRAFYRWALGAQLVTANPMDGIRSMRRIDGLPRPMPLDVLERLFAACPTTADSPPPALRDRAMLLCLLHGMRSVEVCRLTVGAVEYVASGPTLCLTVIGKGRHVRQVYLNTSAAEALAVYLLQAHAPDRWRAWVAQLDMPTELDKLLFVFGRWQAAFEQRQQPVFVEGSRGFRRDDVNNIFNKYKHAAGIVGRWGPHSLRHTCATELLSRGEDIRSVQDVLGHRSILHTQVYTQVLPHNKMRAANKLPSFGAVLCP